MAKKEITDDLVSIESDFANLARLAASGAHEDTRLLLARLVRKAAERLRAALMARLSDA